MIRSHDHNGYQNGNNMNGHNNINVNGGMARYGPNGVAAGSVAAVNRNVSGNNYPNYQNSGNNVLGADGIESNNKMDVPPGLQLSAARQQQERARDDSKAGDGLASDDQHLVGQDNILLLFLFFLFLFFFFVCFFCLFFLFFFLFFVVWITVQKKKIIVLW